MKNKIYKVNGEFISADNSTEAINKLRKTGEYRKIDCEFICDTQKIIPTTETGKMMLFEVTDNTNIEHITAAEASVALQTFFDIHKPITLYAKLICFVNNVL